MAEIGDVFPRRNLPDEAEAWGRHLEGHVRAVGKTLQQVKQAVDNSTRAASGISATISSQGVIIDGLISGSNSVSESVEISIQEANLAAEEARAAKDEAAASLVDARQALDGLGDLEEDLLDPATGKVTVALATANTAAQEAAQAQTDATDALNKALEAEGGVSGALNAIQDLEDELEPRITTAQQDATAAAQEAAQAKQDALTAINAADDAADDAQDALDQALAAMNTAVDAQTSADGKNKVWYTASAPAGSDHSVGDTWFDGANGNRINEWDGSNWVVRQMGTDAIANLAITNALIANLDAAKITTGELEADRIGANSITAEKLVIGVVDNAQPNGYFDDGTAGWSQLPGGWSLDATPYNGHPNSLLIGTTSETEAITGDAIPVTPGQSWIFDGMYMAPDGARVGGLRLQYSSDGGATWVGATGPAANAAENADWASFDRVKYVIPEGVSHIRARLAFVAGSERVYLNALKLRLQGAGELIVDGSITGDKVNANSVAAKIGEFVEVQASKIIGDTGSLNSAFIGQLVGDQAFVTSMYTNRVIVDPQEFAPGPGGFEGAWDLGAQASFSSNDGLDPTGRGIVIARDGSDADRQAWGPRLPARRGQIISATMRGTWQGVSNTGAWEARMYWFDRNGAGLDYALIYSGSENVTIETTVEVPTGVSFGQLRLSVSARPGSEPGDRIFRSLSVRPQTGSVLIEDGAITGDKVDATSVAAEIGEFIEVRASNIVSDTGAMNQAFIGQLVGDAGFLGSLYTNRVIVSPDRNLIPNGALETRTAAGWPATATYRETFGPPTNLSGVPNVAFSAGQGYEYGFSNMGVWEVTPGETVVFELWVKADIAGSVLFFTFQDQSGPNNSAGGRITNWTSVEGGAAGGQGPISNFTLPTSWVKVVSTKVIPAGVTSIVMQCAYFNHTSGTTRDAAIYMAGLRLYKQSGAILLEDGAITGDKVNAQSVAAKIGEFVEVKASRVIGDTGAMNAAFVGQLLSDAAYVDNFYANRILVDSANMTPGPLGYESQYSLTRASIVNNSNNPTGRAFRFDGGTSSDGRVIGPAVPVTAGLTYYGEARAGFYGSTNRGGNLELRIRWYDSKTKGLADFISQSTLATLVDGSASQVFGGSAEAPSGATYGRAFFYVTNQSGAGDWAVVNSSFRAQTSSVLIADGAITASKIKAKAIEANHIAVDALDSFQITSPKIQSVSAANRGIKWDGSQFVGYNNSGVETFRLDATRATIKGGLIEGASVRTAPVGKPAVVLGATANGGGLWVNNSAGGMIATLQTGGGSEGDPGLYFLDDTGTATKGQVRGYLGKVTGASMMMQLRASAGDVRLQLDDTSTGGLQTEYDARGVRVNSEGIYLYARPNREFFAKLTAQTGRIENWNVSGGGVWFYNLANTTAAANMVSSSVDWKVLRSTSLRKYKLDIEPLDVDPYAILDVTPSTWFDKGQVQKIERDRKIAEAKEAGVMVFDPEYKPWPEKEPRRIPGYIAEDMEAAGLGILCQYDGDGELVGISYDRISAALALAIRENKERIDNLERMMK